MLHIYLLNLIDDSFQKQIHSMEEEMKVRLFGYTRISEPTDLEKIIRQAEADQMDAILCRWDQYDAVMSHKPLISIYPITLTGFDTSVILFRLKQHLKKHHLEHLTRVVLGTSIVINVQLSVLEEMFGFKLYNEGWAEHLPQSYFDHLKEMGYEVVICRKDYQEQVERSGLHHFYDIGVYDAINFFQDLKNTIRQVAEGVQLKTTLKDMQIMLNYSFEAICILDSRGQVTSYNERAAKMFLPKRLPSYSGMDFSDLVPVVERHELMQVLSGEENYFSRVVEVNKTMGMLNITPNIIHNVPDGAIVHFTSLKKLDEMETQVKNELYVKGHFAKYHFEDIVGESDVMLKTKRQAELFAKYNSSILLCGESGSGKELFVQSIHNSSMRRDQPFVAVNCGSLPTNLLESELFGYVDGAFTGALKKGKKGLFEIANKGTIFLDEITEMDMQGQSRLLRVLEEREVMRIGDDKVIPIDVRVIAATNRNIEQLIDEGKFREDLYYRLNVLTLYVPPLRQRDWDVVLIANSFLEKFGKKYQKYLTLSDDAQKSLCKYHWKGNVRQLRNFCERLTILADQKVIPAEMIEEELRMMSNGGYRIEQDFRKTGISSSVTEVPETGKMSPEKTERIRIINALRQAGGSREQASLLLGISKPTLWRKMKKYQITDI